MSTVLAVGAGVIMVAMIGVGILVSQGNGGGSGVPNPQNPQQNPTGLAAPAAQNYVKQTLANVLAEAQGYYSAQGGSFSGLSDPAALSTQAAGVTFTSAPASASSGHAVTYSIGSQYAVFSMYDSSTGACVYAADVQASSPSSEVGGSAPYLSPGTWWATDKSCPLVPSTPYGASLG